MSTQKKPALRSITVRELRDALEGWDDDQIVVFASDYGDITHTTQAHAINGDLEVRELEESGYSVSGYAIVDEDDASDPEQRAGSVLVLS